MVARIDTPTDAGRDRPGRPFRHALVLLVAVLLVTTVTPQIAPAQESEPPPPSGSLSLVERDPWSRDEQPVSFRIAVDGDPALVRVEVAVHRPTDDLEELHTSYEQPVGAVLHRTPALPVAELGSAGDGTTVLTLTPTIGPAEDFRPRLGQPGVYPVVVTSRAEDGTVLDELRTPLLHLGDGTQPLPSVALLLDVAAPPSLSPDGTRSLDDGSIEAVRTVVDIVRQAREGVTVAARPDTLDALASLGSPEGDALLAPLVGVESLALPYLPMPVSSLAATDLLGLLPGIIAHGRSAVVNAVDPGDSGQIVLDDVWDPATSLTPGAAVILQSLGYRHVLARSTDAGDDDEGLAAAGPFPLLAVDRMDVVVVDSALSRRWSLPRGDDIDAGHRAVAELVVRDRGDATPVLVRPFGLDADPVLVAALEVLTAPGSPFSVSGLGSLLSAPPGGPDRNAALTSVELAELTGPPGPDLSTLAGRILEVEQRRNTFGALIEADSSRSNDLLLLLATVVSSATPSPNREPALAAVETVLAQAFDNVRLGGQTDVNLTSRHGTLPVTILNANPFPVRVVIRVRSDRLRFPEGEVLQVTARDEQTRVDVPVEALATGSVPVFVELWTGDDRIQLHSRGLNVRSTAVSGVGLALSLGALVVLSSWWIRTWRRTRRERVAAAAGAGHPGD